MTSTSITAATGRYMPYEVCLELATLAFCTQLVDEHTRLVAELYEDVLGVKPEVSYVRKQDNTATEVDEDLAKGLGGE